MNRALGTGPPGLVLASAVAAGAVAIAPLAPVRPLITLGFISVCPGLALVGLLRVGDGTQRLVLSTAVSWSLVTVIAGISLYAGYWSPTTIFSILIGVTLVGAALQMRHPSPGGGRVDGAA
jgi:hypothetical protein